MLIECTYQKTKGIRMENETLKNKEVQLESTEVEVKEELVLDSEEKVEKVKKPLTKHDEAQALMKSAEMIVSKADKDVKEVEEVVSEHVAEFRAKKEVLDNTAIAESKELLAKTHYEYGDDNDLEPFELSLGCTKEKVELKPISAGHFSGLILGFIGALATVATWLYFAVKKTGVELVPGQIPEQNTLDTIFTWIGGGMTGSVGNPTFGMLTVALTALFVGFMFYKMRLALKENKNYKIANQAFEKSQNYLEEQKESKTEMERIDAHITSATPLIENYTVILNEQNAKLKRIIHIEGMLEDMNEYHPNSKHIMEETANLLKRAERFVNVPVSKEGRFNEDSINAYREAKALYSTYITKVYS
jgi:hypothetical protein